VDALKARDLPVLVGDQRGPVEAGAVQGPAEPYRVLEVVAEAAGVDEELLRHAAADHAGAAEAVFLGNLHPGTLLARDAPRAHRGRAAADDEQIEVVLAHLRARDWSNGSLDGASYMLMPRRFSSRRASVCSSMPRRSPQRCPSTIESRMIL